MFVGDADNLLDRIDRAQDIRDVGHRDQARLFVE